MQCAHCATPVPDDARFCHSCGSQVSDAEGQANATASMDGAAFAHLEKMLREDTEGEFVVERMLGRGGMAVVYLATEVHLHRKVALKVLPPELTFGHGVERFKREARTAAALDHPNIIPIYRVASGGKIFWYAMKFLEGRALDDVLKERGQFGFDETIDILAQVADALDYAHEHKVVHRDIKPANVMLDNRNRVVVTDFGIAKALTEGTLTASGSVIGTPYYMSPEQGLGKPVTGAADQYSVAVMAYRMLAGQVPFEGDSAIDILHKHCTVPPPPLQTLRGELGAHAYRAVHRALAKNPEQRFSSVTAFVDALADPNAASRRSESELATMVLSAQELTSATGATAAPGVTGAPSLTPTGTVPVRRRWWPAVVAALVLGGGGFAAWQLTSGREAVTPAAPDSAAVAAAATPAAPPPPTTGVIRLEGLPARATVTAAGERRAEPQFELAAGTIPIRVEAPDFEPWTADITLRAGDTVPVTFAGTRRQRRATTPTRTAQPRGEPVREAPPPAAAAAVPVRLEIGVSPAGATVLVDGTELPSGRLVETQVLPGQHLITAVHPTAGRKDTTVTVLPGQPLRVVLRLR